MIGSARLREANQRLIRARRSLDRVRDELAVSRFKKRVSELLRKIGLTRTGQFALLLAVVLWIVGRIVGGTVLYVLAYGTIVLVGVSFLLAPRRLRLTSEREGLFPRAQEGDLLEVQLKTKAQRSLTSFQLEERVPEALGLPLRVPIARVRAGDELDHAYGLNCVRRGVYQVGPLVAIASDPIGVVQRETVLQEPFELLVHPRVSRVSLRPLSRLFEDPPIRPPVSKPWPTGTEFYGMREFRPGDDLRRIVWRATARTGKIMVREAEQGITDHITIVLDTDRGSHSRDGEYSESFEVGIRVVASLGAVHLNGGFEIKVETNGGALTRPMRGRDKTTRFLDVLTRGEMDRNPLSAALRRLVADPRRDAQLIVVTPHLGTDEATQLKFLLDKGVNVTVVALIWNDEDTETMGRAAALGCQVSAVRMDQDLSAALHQDIGAGNRL
ncbi:MAG TPA: DUF58 domain-containing protein [Actinomycetota bacterium]|nr:DUF58 domain-containing protein [Actinomycetota bacterium]